MQKKTISILILTLFLIKLTAYFVAPFSFLFSLITFTAIITMAVFFLLKKDNLAWRLFIGELLLCGSGAYFELFGLSMRTWFLFIFLGFWFIFEYRNINKKQLIFATIPLLLVFTASLIGLVKGNEFKAVFQDALPFLYILIYFPTIKYFQDKKELNYLKNLVISFIIGSATYSLFIFVMFSSRLMEIHGIYYNWFRDFGLGKITDLGNNFYRVVLPEHLLITPLLLIIIYYLIKQKSRLLWLLLFCGAFVLSLNFSRGYFLGLIAGLAILRWTCPAQSRFNRDGDGFKQWLFVSTMSIAMIIITIMGLSFITSHGQTFGLDLIGIRAGSVVRPNSEESSGTRMMLLPNILAQIKTNPITGVGLGSTITYHNAFLARDITTRQYDWGYLEIWAEFGLPLALILLTIYLILMTKLIKQKNTVILAVFVFLLISNITAPILTHIFGIIIISLTIDRCLFSDILG